MRSLRIVHRPRRGMEETRFHTYRWRRVYRRATDECAVPPLDIGVWAIQLSPYRVGVAGPYHTRLLTSPAFRPCCCSLALSGLGEAVASESCLELRPPQEAIRSVRDMAHSFPSFGSSISKAV